MRFLNALTVGRGIRFTLLGYLGAHYGRHIVNFFAQYYRPVLGVLIAFSVVGGLYALFEYKRRRKAEGPKTSHPSSQPGRRTA
jgi:membrane protein DedA with SNARE-associated domain